MGKQCLFCGASLDDDAIFCDECGKRQDDEAAKEIAVERAQEVVAAKEQERADMERAKVETEVKAHLETTKEVRPTAEKVQQEMDGKREQAECTQNKKKSAEVKECENDSTKVNIKAEAEARIKPEEEQQTRTDAGCQEMIGHKEEDAKVKKEREVQEKKNNSTYLALASLILGIASIILIFSFTILSLPLCIAGTIFSIKGMKTAKRGMAIAGLIMNGLVLVIFVVAFVAVSS